LIKLRPEHSLYYCNTRKEAKSIGFDDDLIYSEIIENKQPMKRIDSEFEKIPFQKWTEDKKKIEY